MIKLVNKISAKELSYLSLLLVVLAFLLLGCGQNKESKANSTLAKPTNNFKMVVDSNIKIICSSPGFSSNPHDYIKAHQVEYNQVVQLGQPALDYILDRFKKTTSNGLDSWIMASLCCDILGEKNPVASWSSGREWYEKYSQKQ